MTLSTSTYLILSCKLTKAYGLYFLSSSCHPLDNQGRGGDIYSKNF
jgi:hypothetical protein